MKKTVPEVHIEQISEIVPSPEGSTIVMRARAARENERADREIAVTRELAPATALALLATTAKARSGRDGLDPALDVFGAAVVRSSSHEKVRLQLLFDNGAVLPVELNLEAAEALSRGLTEYLGASQRRLAPRKA